MRVSRMDITAMEFFLFYDYDCAYNAIFQFSVPRKTARIRRIDEEKISFDDEALICSGIEIRIPFSPCNRRVNQKCLQNA